MVHTSRLYKQFQTTGKRWSSSLGKGWGANSSSLLQLTMLQNISQGLWPWTDILVWCKQWKRDMRFGIWEDTIKLDLQEVGAGTGLIGLRIGTRGGCLW